ncbi:MAG: hypothetical protein ABIK73_07665 [candidate division WOR-3 bacterium]
MIVADAPFFLREDELVKYVANGVRVECRVIIEEGVVEITLRVYDTLVITNQSVGENTIYVDFTELANIEGNGNDDVAKFVNCVQRYARSYLQNIPGNSGVNFTIT